jgi:hypothetical protein
MKYCVIKTIVLICFFQISCASRQPSWVFNYHLPGKVCAVGTSQAHIKGFAYQQATAISRAIQQIAIQKGIKVDTTIESYLRGTKDHASSHLSVYTIQSTQGQKVVATVRDTWLDKKNQTLYVWMVSD